MAEATPEGADTTNGIGNEEGAKPEPKAMSIVFVDTADNETVFKLKSNTKLKKAMDVYAQRLGVQRETLRFLYDGDRVLDDHTPDHVSLSFFPLRFFAAVLAGGFEGGLLC